MSAEFKVVPYDPRDLDALVGLWQRSWASAVPRLADATPIEVLRERFAKEASEHWTVLVGFTGATPIGFAAYVEADNHLDQLFVDPDFHFSGVGSALLDLVKAAMPGGIWLSTAVENASACQFYERRDFVREKLGTHPTLGHEITFYRWSGAGTR